MQVGSAIVLSVDQRIGLQRLPCAQRPAAYFEAQDRTPPLTPRENAVSFIARHRFVRDHMGGDISAGADALIGLLVERFGPEPTDPEQWLSLYQYGLRGLIPNWLDWHKHDPRHDLFMDVWTRRVVSALAGLEDETPFSAECEDYCEFLTAQVVAVRNGEAPHSTYFTAWRTTIPAERMDASGAARPAPPVDEEEYPFF